MADTLLDVAINREPYAPYIPSLEELPQGDIDGVPLTSLPIWCAWKIKPPRKEGDKPGKVPVSPRDGRTKGWSFKDGDGVSRCNLDFFDTAEQAIQYANQHRLQGIGIAINREYGIAGGDPDHSRNPETGEMSERAREIILSANTYAEVSPGQAGYRFIFIGSFGGFTGNRDDLEFYEDGRFLTITGDHVEGTPRRIMERDLTELGKRHFPLDSAKSKKTKTARTDQPDLTEKPPSGERVDLDSLMLPKHVEEWIKYGIADPSLDRSNCLFGAAIELLKAGVSESQTADILTAPEHGIHVVALEHSAGSHTAARRWVERYTLPEARKRAVEANGGSLPAPKRAYMELLTDAQNMDEFTPPDQVKDLAREAGSMERLTREMVLKAIKKSTGLNISDLRAITKEAKRTSMKPEGVSKAKRHIRPMMIDFFPDIVTDEEGEPVRALQTIPNIAAMLDYYGIQVSYDVIAKKVKVIVPGASGSPDNADNSALSSVISLAKLNEIPTDQVPAFIATIADERQHNPVADWITGAAWDGQDRLPQLYQTLVLADGYPASMRDLLVRRWLISAVAAALMPRGFRTRGVLTLQGPQSIGKSDWLKSLVSDVQLRETAIKVDHLLDPANKDSVLGAITHWLVELGELDGSFRKADVARIKGFITADMDKVRRPYDRLESEYQRRTVFFASVNDSQFLVDETGNTRFWTVAVERINSLHGIDMQQVWAQVVELWRSGEKWWLTRDEETELEKLNRGHRVVSSIRELVETGLAWESPANYWERRTASEVLKTIGFDKPTNAQAREAGAVLRERGCDSRMSNGVTRFMVPKPMVSGFASRG